MYYRVKIKRILPDGSKFERNSAWVPSLERAVEIGLNEKNRHGEHVMLSLYAAPQLSVNQAPNPAAFQPFDPDQYRSNSIRLIDPDRPNPGTTPGISKSS